MNENNEGTQQMNMICGFFGAHPRDAVSAMLESMPVTKNAPGELYISPDNDLALGFSGAGVSSEKTGRYSATSANGKYYLQFVGQIYNIEDVRIRLGSADAGIGDASHAEILLYGWREMGEALLPLLNGSFILSLLDLGARRLFLVRDRFGQKPLFYARWNRAFVFASNLAAPLACPYFSPKLDLENVQRYICWGYFPGERTFLKNLFSLSPGHILTLDISNGELHKRAWWKFTLDPDSSWLQRKEESLCEELRSLTGRSITRRLAGLDSCGLFLSGGMDSSAIAASFQHIESGCTLSAFSMGFQEPSFDESMYAGTVATHCGLPHKIKMMDLTAAIDLVPRLMENMLEPFGDSSLLPTWLLATFTREHVANALTGDAGDELFAGYDTFLALKPSLLYAKLVPGWLHRSARFLAELVPPADTNMSLEFKIKRALRGLSHPESHWLPAWMGPVDPADLKDIFTAPLSAEQIYEDVDIADGKTAVERALLFYTRYYLPNDGVVKTGRASALAGLECHAVFLDNDIVDFCRHLPQEFKLRGNIRKYLLKKAFSAWLPREIISRRKKGFGIPLNKWMREYSFTLNDLGTGMINENELKRRLALHKDHKGDHRVFLWSWLSLQTAWRNVYRLSHEQQSCRLYQENAD